MSPTLRVVLFLIAAILASIEVLGAVLRGGLGSLAAWSAGITAWTLTITHWDDL